MATVCIDVPAGSEQPRRLSILEQGANWFGYERCVFPEPWGTSRPVAFHIWTDREIGDSDLAYEFAHVLGPVAKEGWLRSQLL